MWQGYYPLLGQGAEVGFYNEIVPGEVYAPAKILNVVTETVLIDNQTGNEVIHGKSDAWWAPWFNTDLGPTKNEKAYAMKEIIHIPNNEFGDHLLYALENTEQRTDEWMFDTEGDDRTFTIMWQQGE